MESHIDHTRRQLTYDELKAAEAAFQGYAFNEDWSEARSLFWHYYEFLHDGFGLSAENVINLKPVSGP